MKLVIKLSACIDLNRLPIVDSTGIVMPVITAIDWQALNWMSNEYDLVILVELGDNRVEYLLNRLRCKVVYKVPDSYQYFLREGDESFAELIDCHRNILFKSKHKFGQGILAELKLYLIHNKND